MLYFINSNKVPAIDETYKMIQLGPDRIGHGTCIQTELGGADELVDLVLKNKIPLGIFS